MPERRPTSTVVSTPGKLILMGEHAAVYGATALVAACGLRLRVSLRREAAPGLRLQLDAIGHQETLGAADLLEYCGAQRRAWDLYAADPGAESFARMLDDDPARLVKVALGEAAVRLDGPATLDGLRLNVRSELPLGSGFGSSAAAAVGIVAATFSLAGEPAPWSVVGPVVMDVERRQHGFPSGIDAATVFHGGVLRARRSGDQLDFEPVPARPELLRELTIIQTGVPPEPTGEVVAAVRGRRDTNPDEFAEILAAMNAATTGFDAALLAVDSSAPDLVPAMRAYERCLERIGVVPAPVRQTVGEIERSGGAAKLSGAGSLRGPGAGCLLAILGDGDLPDGLERVEASLGAEGVRVESTR